MSTRNVQISAIFVVVNPPVGLQPFHVQYEVRYLTFGMFKIVEHSEEFEQIMAAL